MADEGRNDCNERSDAAPASENADATPSLDATLEVLAHHHRRELLRALVEAPDDTASIAEITGRLRDREIDRTGERPGRDHLQISLHHVHLPKLVDAGLVEYDPRSKELCYWQDERLEDVLDFLESTD